MHDPKIVNREHRNRRITLFVSFALDTARMIRSAKEYVTEQKNKQKIRIVVH